LSAQSVKLKDFFISHKIDTSTAQDTSSDGPIIVDRRPIDDRYKVTPETRAVFRLVVTTEQ
jgi:hypothetical protein